jgi:hypothetical protein
MKIFLKEEMETLLIPLYGKAQMSKKGIFRDRDAKKRSQRSTMTFQSFTFRRKRISCSRFAQP